MKKNNRAKIKELLEMQSTRELNRLKMVIDVIKIVRKQKMVVPTEL